MLPEIWQKRLNNTLQVTALLAHEDIPSSLHAAAAYHLRTLHLTKAFRLRLFWRSVDLHCEDYDFDDMCRKGAALQLIHESTLIIDDILDRGQLRRGQRPVHIRFGRVIATSLAGWFSARALRVFSHSPRLVNLVSTLIENLAKAEALQWQYRLFPRPIDIGIWEDIALGDTGALFRFAVSIPGGNPSEEIDRLAMVYHGLDDIEDKLNIGGLSGGGEADIRDNIPTIWDTNVDPYTYVENLLQYPYQDFQEEASELKYWYQDIKCKV
jgi:geranylgeranyl pyrophosphate synthase